HRRPPPPLEPSRGRHAGGADAAERGRLQRQPSIRMATGVGLVAVRIEHDAVARRTKVAVMSTLSIRVFSVDDHPLVREGIAAVIKKQPDMLLVASAKSGRDAIEVYREHQPDVTLMDLRLPDMSGIDAMIAIRAEFPEARVMMLTTFDGDVEIERAL